MDPRGGDGERVLGRHDSRWRGIRTRVVTNVIGGISHLSGTAERMSTTTVITRTEDKTGMGLPVRLGIVGCASVAEYAMVEPARLDTRVHVAAVASRYPDKSRD